MYVVYGLEDPRDHLYHYIGITDDVYRRFCDHIRGNAGNIEKNGWIFECRQANVMIIMREIERIAPETDAAQRVGACLTGRLPYRVVTMVCTRPRVESWVSRLNESEAL